MVVRERSSGREKGVLGGISRSAPDHAPDTEC